ncbi:MAG TPA: glycosyltransferase family 4 protein [Polyangia bacterium]|nr:glycosyltransferase family 4 protein [Polyangia bacterium]
MKRRILFVIKNLQQGGTERQVLQMMRSVDRSRFEVALCTLSPEAHYAVRADEAPRYALTAKGDAAVEALRAVMEDFRPDLVHSFRDVVNRWVWRALGQLSFRPEWLMSVRGRPVLPLDLAWASVMYRRAFRVAVNSLGVAATLMRYARIPARRIAVVPNLIDEGAFSPATPARRAAAREALGLAPGAFVWVLPGRLSWVKNQIGLLAALWIAKRRGALPDDAVLVLAGRRRDSVPSAVVPRLLRWLGLARHVRLMDAVKAPSILYDAADALVLPSFAEGMPNVVLEAQLAEVPVVVAPEANRDLLVTHGESGFVASSVSPRELATQMARLMSLPELERRRMGRSGRAELLRRLPTRVVTAELRALYEAALDGEGAAAVPSRVSLGEGRATG